MRETTEESLLIVGPRRPGRPRVVNERLIPVSACIPAGEYDRLCKMASTRKQSLSALVRDLISAARQRQFPIEK